MNFNFIGDLINFLNKNNADPTDVNSNFDEIKSSVNEVFTSLQTWWSNHTDSNDNINEYKGNDIDSDGDGKVNAADNADNADNATAYKNNDIDSNGDGQVDSADIANKVDTSKQIQVSGSEKFGYDSTNPNTISTNSTPFFQTIPLEIQDGESVLIGKVGLSSDLSNSNNFDSNLNFGICYTKVGNPIPVYGVQYDISDSPTAEFFAIDINPNYTLVTNTSGSAKYFFIHIVIENASSDTTYDLLYYNWYVEIIIQ